MPKILDDILDHYYEKLEKDLLESKDANIVYLAKKQLKQDIVREIKDELIQEEGVKIRQDISSQIQEEQLEEAKTLFLEGLLLALFVGLFTNECSELISALKEASTLDTIAITFIIMFVLLVCCILLFHYAVVHKFPKLFFRKHGDKK